MSASKFSQLARAERNSVIAETDKLFRERTGVTRQLDPDRDKALVRRWISIRDEVMARGNGPGTGGSASTSGMVSRGTNALSQVLPTIAEALQAGIQMGAARAAQTPSWITIARSQIGQREFAGSAFNPRILQYILSCTDNFNTDSYTWANKHDWQAWVNEKRAAGLMIPNQKPTNQIKWLLDGDGRGANDEGFYWCAAFVNWCLRQTGIAGRNHGLVSNWRTWGTRIADPKVGAILIRARGNSSWGHIAFVDQIDGQWKSLGGNQSESANGPSNAVSSAGYPTRVTALIWPPSVAMPD